MMRDPYSVLGVRRNAGQDEIKAAWRAMAKSVHPDQNQDDPLATQRFAEAGRAYEVLKNPALRSRYDTMRREAELRRMEDMLKKSREPEPLDPGSADEILSKMFDKKGAAEPKGGDQRSYARAEPPKAAPNMARPRPEAPRAEAPRPAASRPDAKGEPQPAGASRADPMGAFTRTAAPAAELISAIVRRIRGTAQKRADKVPDLVCEASISVEDLYRRAKVTVSLPDEESLKVAIPAGATDGQTIRLRELGYTVAGLRRGDAVVTLRVRQDGPWRTDGYDLRLTLPVSIENAVLGCETTIETLSGPMELTVPAWSGSDRIIRIEGQGLADADGKRGDLLVEVRIMLWDKPDDKMTDLMRSLREGLYL